MIQSLHKTSPDLSATLHNEGYAIPLARLGFGRLF
jgi:hypothetical protein